MSLVHLICIQNLRPSIFWLLAIPLIASIRNINRTRSRRVRPFNQFRLKTALTHLIYFFFFSCIFKFPFLLFSLLHSSLIQRKNNLRFRRLIFYFYRLNFRFFSTIKSLVQIILVIPLYKTVKLTRLKLPLISFLFNFF